MRKNENGVCTLHVAKSYLESFRMASIISLFRHVFERRPVLEELEVLTAYVAVSTTNKVEIMSASSDAFLV